MDYEEFVVNYQNYSSSKIIFIFSCAAKHIFSHPLQNCHYNTEDIKIFLALIITCIFVFDKISSINQLFLKDLYLRP